MSKPSKLLRCALAVTLACGLMIPATALTAFAENESTATPPATDVGAADAPAVQADDGFAPLAGSDFQVRGGKPSATLDPEGGDYHFDGTTLHILTSTPLAVRTTPQPVAGKEGEFAPAQTANNIQIEPGVKADLTLAGVNIATTGTPLNIVTNKYDTEDGSAAVVPADIKRKTMLHLTLADGSVNTLTCTNNNIGTSGSPGLRCGFGSVLVIDDEVRNLDSSNNIVTPVNGVVPYDVTLVTGQTLSAGDPLSRMDSANPGSLIADAGAHSACIGGASKEDSGTIIINGGNITAKGDTGNANQNTGAGIGGGDGGSGTVITINGGIVNAQASYHGAGIGAGWSWENPGNATPKDDALVIPTAPLDNGYNYWDGTYFHNVGGDITINGGFVVARAGGHGNAFGQACGGTYSSNRDHIMRVTGGTLLPYGTADRFDIGGNYGYLIITGGSVNCNVWDANREVNTYPKTQVYKGDYKFQGIGGTAFSTSGITTWEQIEALEGGQLPEADKVKLVTIDLSPDIVGDKNCKVEDWTLTVNGEKRSYGSPSYLDNGKLYLWLSEEDAKKPVAVELKYRDENDKVVELETIETLGDGGTAAKRWVKFDLPTHAFPNGLEKRYDGLPLAKWSLAQTSIEVTSKTGITRKLDRDVADDGTPYVTFTYQAYREDGTLGPMSEEATEMPADTGRMHFTMHSTQFAKDPELAVTYWGHETSGDCVITPAKAVVDLASPAWVRLNEDDGSYETVKQGDDEPGTHLRLEFGIQSASDEALTCREPTGFFQVLVDGKAVGERIALDDVKVKEASRTQHSQVSIVEGPQDADDKTKTNRWATKVVYYLDPTLLDGELSAGSDSLEHEVTVQYIPDKNYVESIEDNPDNEASKPTVIVPVQPVDKPTIDGEELEFKDDKLTVTKYYSQFHQTSNPDLDDFFSMRYDSTSAAKITYSVSNPAVADLVWASDGTPEFDEDGNVKVQVLSCGTSVITLTQASNAFYSGQRRVLTINVLPDPSLKPEVQIRLTWRNLTALEEQASPMVASLSALDEVLGTSAARVATDRTHTPPRPGDVLEYTVTGLNLTPGSAWQAATLVDSIDERLELDPDHVELAANYATPEGDTSLPSEEFYAGFDWSALNWVPQAADGGYQWSAPTLSKMVGSIYGGQSSSLRFRAIVPDEPDDGLGERPENDGDDPVITNTPGGEGGYGKDEIDLKPGEAPTDPTPLKPEEIKVVDSVEPTPVLPKDPAAADIVTTVKVEQTGHTEEHDGDRFMVGDTLTVTVTSTNKGPDSKLSNAVVKATLPVGMEPKEGTIKLVDGQGKAHDVPMGAYDPKTGVIAVNAGDLYFGDDAVLTFDVEVISTSETRQPTDPDDPDDPDAPGPSRPTDPTIEGGTLGETPTDEWEREHPADPGAEPSDPADDPKPGTPFEPGRPWEDLEDELVSTPPAVDPDMPPVLPSNPKLEDDEEGPADIAVAKEAENLDSADGATHVGDVVRYTITLSNAKEHSMWYDAVIRDDVPAGLEPLSGSIRAVGADGVEREVPDGAYDPAARVLAVAVGDLPGGRAATVSFDALVTEEAVGADIGNVASASGTRPSDAEPGEVAGGAPRPVPGAPFAPEGGWDAYEREHPSLSNPAPAYPAGVTEKGGVVAEPRPEPAPGAPGGADGTGDGGAGSRTPIRLAQTGDELVAPSVALVMAAAAAGVMLTALMAQRSRRREELRARYAGRW